MYPINLTNKAAGGYAVANDAGEHQALSDAGYEPKWEAPAIETKTYPDGSTATGVASLPDQSPVDQDADDAATAAAEEIVHTVETLREALDAKGIVYDKRWGVARLQAALSGE